MDDDLTFGASVWGATDTTSTSTPIKPLVSSGTFDDEPFDEFDNFGSPMQTSQDDIDNDDFGDFGDFGEAPVADSSSFDDGLGFGIAGPSQQREWHALPVDPYPSGVELAEEIYDIMGPLWENEDITTVTTDIPIREVEGINQILVTSESRELYRMLLQSAPSLRPPNWTRSRIRRQHLIALGIPVNLDEMLPRANGKPLPPLQINTRPMSAPPGPRNHSYPDSSAPVTTQNSRAGTPQPGGQNIATQFGPKPELDMGKINKLLELDSGIDNLTMQPLASLERYLIEFKSQTANTSALLTYLLQSRDALQQDSEMYNGLIAEMVGEAQKIKSGKPRTVTKRGSAFG
ncbi:hypothetical protein BDQ17DRAFT_1351922 [Cyathus striatus]|nr:hypothetical protein BDQ17DRAFT_1351922 [Cyathus striatus]